MTPYYYSPEGARYHDEGKPPREPTRDLPDLTDEEKQERMDSFNDLGYHNIKRPDVSRERIKDAEIERLNKIIEVMQEQSQHHLGEANASADYWHGVASFYMQRAYDWEQQYDELFAALHPKCESCASKGFTYQEMFTESGHPYRSVIPCPQGCGALPASEYLSGKEQAYRTQKFIDDRLDLERLS